MFKKLMNESKISVGSYDLSDIKQNIYPMGYYNSRMRVDKKFFFDTYESQFVYEISKKTNSSSKSRYGEFLIVFVNEDDRELHFYSMIVYKNQKGLEEHKIDKYYGSFEYFYRDLRKPEITVRKIYKKPTYPGPKQNIETHLGFRNSMYKSRYGTASFAIYHLGEERRARKAKRN
jgi:hypothetical protein